jgi:signal transduction histidine kinase/DNA-binding response OmpR family regulator
MVCSPCRTHDAANSRTAAGNDVSEHARTDEAPVVLSERNLWQRYLLLLLLAVLLLFGVGWAALSTGAELNSTLREVSRLQEATKRLSVLLSRVVDLETGQRGFLLTGDETYLKPYREAEREIPAAFRDVDEALGDYPEARAEVAAIEESLAKKRGEIATSLAVYEQQGPQHALALIRSGFGNEMMEEIRSSIARLTLDTRGLIAEKQGHLEKVIAQRNVSIFSALGLAIVASIAGFVLLRRHLSSLHKEQMLRDVAARSDRASREKSAFLANMSHEIRTPMNAIFGFSQLLAERVTDAQDKRYVDAIVASGRSLLALINDVLDLSRIEAGKLDVRAVPMNLRELIDSVQLVFSQLATEKGLQLEVRMDSSLPDGVELDPARLRQMLFNLVGNAIKYTDRGYVRLRASATTDPDDELRVTVLIEVEDSGIGIAATDQERIFEPFAQADAAPRSHEGTGLGLSITRRLARLMGGEISLQSAPGKGSCFGIRLPQVPLAVLAEVPLAPAAALGGPTPQTIVVADDVALNRLLIEALLRGSGHHLIMAEDGEQAVALTRTHRPAVVLMDVRMPRLDGIGALARLRADSELAAIPVIAITASSLLSEEAELREHFDGYVRKPITRELLLAELQRVLPAIMDADTDEPPGNSAALLAVLTDLAQLESAAWPRLQATLAVHETGQFAAALLQLAERCDSAPLRRYAQQLSTAAGHFDPVAMETLLADFPRQRARLAAHQDLN